MIISPSILACNFLKLEDEIKSFDSIKDISFHLDVMDGHYVPNLTFGKVILKDLHKITKHKLDAHFMVTNPEDYVTPFKDIGLNNFTYHWETVHHHDSLISELKKHYPSVGISLNPGTNEKDIPLYILEKIDLILVMSVNPGFGGQKFIDYSVKKVQYFNQIKKDHQLRFDIQVDGGVTDKNAKSLIDAGATNLVAGSYIFKEDPSNYSKQVESLRN
jgi:ribulose-phosphate 3-epimerase